MGASVVAYFPGATDKQIDEQDGFWNDDHAWANFMVEQETDPSVPEAMKKLNAAALLTFKTHPMEDKDVAWVTPQELRDAAIKLRDAVRNEAPEAKTLLDAYERGANGEEPLSEEFIRDLDDIIKKAEWGERMGATQITLEVNW